MTEKEANSLTTLGINKKSETALQEERILEFWDKENIFQKSLEKSSPKGDFIFYDGPPFATGTPHYGHIVASLMKDIVPRYWTMKGYHVDRRWGWDCHGLPIENIVEEELCIKSKKEIEAIGIEKFNNTCQSKVMLYADEWKKVIGRFGRWVDMENDYKTMDLSFMESVWWVFKQLWDKGLIYEGYKSMHICPRCETTLSQSEVAEGYKDIKDISGTFKFELEDEPNTYILAWTTTPWTLPGNVALAVGKDIDYIKIKLLANESELKANGREFFILAKNLIEKVLGNSEYEILEEMKGKKLEGKKYKPLFDYYVGKGLQNEENGWQIYAGDFVTTEDGTGVVHIAPAFGDDDMNLGKEKNLPFIQHLKMDGRITEEVRDFAGLEVKPKDDSRSTDKKIIKFLKEKKLVFSTEEFEHSYPHCWRCDSPLLNYATSSWFVNITEIKQNALKTAKNINWIPSHIKEGRFGNWLEGAKDWSISRQRFWGSVMPIWRCEKCKELKVIGSVDEIREKFGSPNKLFLVRHGEAENNVKNILSSDLKKNHYPLTKNGREQVKKTASSFKGEKIDLIFSSPFLRTKETAEIIAKELKLEIILDKRLGEFGQGEFDGKRQEEFDIIFPTWPKEILKKREEFGVETEDNARKRCSSFLEEINKKYQNKNIVIVSHGDPLQFIYSIIQEIDRMKAYRNDWYPEKGSLKMLYSKKIDIHKHNIDKITFKCKKCGGEMKRIPDVLDCWFESGSMPYAQIHYPFENKEKFEKNFPAKFIAEGLDQTRAWFYYLHILSTALKNSETFKNVIVNGIVLAEDGKKMSKKLNNYPDPMLMFDKYGSDAIRYYLATSQVMKAEDLNFSEKGVDEIVKKLITRFKNVFNFYNLYSENLEDDFKKDSNNILDKWILAKLNELIFQITNGLDNYEIDKASRPIMNFVDDLSVWYTRRSRDRMKQEHCEDKQMALYTMRYVLKEFSKIVAPFMPFVAEEIYQKTKMGSEPESVHLCEWPETRKQESKEAIKQEEVIELMESVRNLVTLALEKRMKAKIKVRQPLQSLRFGKKSLKDAKEYLELIKDEINVKEVLFDKKLEEDGVEIDFELTEELIQEGIMRDLLRQIQDMRKKKGFTPNMFAISSTVTTAVGQEIIKKYESKIKKTASLKEIIFDKDNIGEEFNINGIRFKIDIKRDGE